jgi:flagellar biosynthesis chaperone FliJ
MNIDINQVLDKLQTLIGQQSTQIAILQIQVEELQRQLAACQKDEKK